MTARDAFIEGLGYEHRDACDRCGVSSAAVLCDECADRDLREPLEEER